MENNNITSGARTSLFKLFSEEKYNIEIPIIQRDYAQGRVSKTEIREDFLNALFQYLDENIPNRDLDFVYGSLIQEENCKSLIPLDGQQRLTTLFLLHWYLANISNNMAIFRETFLRDDKSMFLYQTRASSGEFCDSLIKHDINISELLKPDENKQNSLSKTIKNNGWYFRSWDNDPTICSMLTMLDSIHQIFNNNPEFFRRLIDTEEPIITFLLLNLNEFQLTDDLYIKMNSRGKPLTVFETFKAKLEQYIDTINIGEYTLINEGKVRDGISAKEYFSHKIDTEWANLFWQYRNKKTNTFDSELMNFIRFVFANQYVIDYGTKDDNLDFLIGTDNAKKENDYTDEITFSRFTKENAISEQAIKSLIEILDVLSNEDDKIKSYYEDKYYFDEQQIFRQALNLDLKHQSRIQLYAYLKYLTNNTDYSNIWQWVRVVHNLTANTAIDGSDEIVKAINAINLLIPHSNDIISALQNNSLSIDFFFAKQVLEERIKACLIDYALEWASIIYETEKNPYFEGQIGFLLEFSGILEYYTENNDCNWSVEDNEKYFKKFEFYTYRAGKLFLGFKENLLSDYVLERALLTIGDYLIPASSWRKNFANKTNKMRDYSWKRLLRLNPTNDSEFVGKRMIIKELLSHQLFNPEQLIFSLNDIISNNSLADDNWRKYFIDNPSLIAYCNQGFISDNQHTGSEIQLMNATQMNHYHAEMYSYNLYTKYIQGKPYAPFKVIEYWGVRDSDSHSHVILYDFSYRRKQYAIRIYHDIHNEDCLPYPFEIEFYKPKGRNSEEFYDDDIKSILRKLSYEWFEQFSGYYISCKNETDTLNSLSLLCEELYSLEINLVIDKTINY